MMHGKRAARNILFRKLVFGFLIILIAGVIGIDPIEAASTSQNHMLKVGNSSAIISTIPAFPGAEGFGAQSVGGRGGQVIEVTNLKDSGPGSLRAAIQTSGSRIVVFRVGGTIELESTLKIDNPYITIAGQTAPGGGIALKNTPSNMGATIKIRTHDVIIRYLRVRPGPSSEPSHVLDAVSMPGASNVIIDHSSFSWATDENVDAWYDAHDITIQWSIISEALRVGTGGSGTGMLLGSDGSNSISVHHNLFAHNIGRTPRMNMAGVADVVNNIIYNTKDHPSTIGHEYQPAPPVNYVANFVKKGPDSIRDYLVDTSGGPAEIYVEGDITAGRPTDDLDEVEGVVREESVEFVIPIRHAAAPVTTSSAFDAYDQVLAEVGATLPARDAVDERIVNDVINGTGAIITDPAAVGGWPDLTGGTPFPDSDHDGMPDEWENQYGFDPNNPADGSADADGDGYTNVEEFLNNTEPGSNSEPSVTPTPEPTTEPVPETSFGSMTLGIDGPTSVVPGETFQASVMARDITDEGLYGVQLEINYDPSLISVTNLQVNPNLTFVVLNSADNTSGKISLVASQQGNVPGLTGEVTLLTFDATAGQNPGPVTFTFENEKFSDPQAQGLEFLAESYTVSIDEIPTPEPTDDLTPEPTPDPTEEPTPESTEAPTPEPIPDPTDEPTPEPTPDPTDEPTPDPTEEPTPDPTEEPTPDPTDEPTPDPTEESTPDPTEEPTPDPPEPTDEPIIAVVFGQVILAGRDGNDWSDANVTIDDSGQTGTTDSNGEFSILDVTAGVLGSITVDAPGYLPAICTQPTVVAPETALTTIALLSGDINDDSLVDITDATMVGAGFGQTGPDMLADINRDQILDIFDIVLVSINYGAEGSQTWNCVAN